MSGISKKLMGTTAAGGGFTAIEDVFSTYLYTGTSSTQTITNGIDLAGEGGLVWLKTRSSVFSHKLIDTEVGLTKTRSTNAADADLTYNPSFPWIASFDADGFTLGANAQTNFSGVTYASWTFRKAPRFFDVVTYTGNGSSQTIAHNLGVEPGCIMVKATSSTANWAVWHRTFTATQHIQLNTTSAALGSATVWNSTLPTDSVFSVGNYFNTNSSGVTYVAYLFAHDPLGPSEDGSDGLIACGSFTTDGSGNATVDLGWEPQWALVKPSSAAGNWRLIDNMRGWVNGGTNNRLFADSSGAESAFDDGNPTATGFQMKSAGASITYIYIAIRRGPMRAPESGTEVFKAELHNGNSGTEQFIPSGGTGFPIDLLISADRGQSNQVNRYFINRLADTWSMTSTNINGEAFGPSNPIAKISGYQDRVRIGAAGEINTSSWPSVDFFFRRAPNFFDVVAYTGTGANPQTHNHNLGVSPEMIIIKRRDSANDWIVYHVGNDVDGDGQPWTDYLRLDSTQAGADGAYFSDYQPTSVDFQAAGFGQTGAAGGTYIAYLFATLPGVSKVGSYTGNGSSQTIDCGFTTGARFILIKRTDSTGDWYIWDTARGIVTGNDPHLSLNTTAAEVTTDDSIDPDSSGFIVNQVAATNINVSAASYIFYAIA